jgi:hypothetical protein
MERYQKFADDLPHARGVRITQLRFTYVRAAKDQLWFAEGFFLPDLLCPYGSGS